MSDDERGSVYLTSDERVAALINSVPGLAPAEVNPMIPKGTVVLMAKTITEDFMGDFEWPVDALMDLGEPLPQPVKDHLDRMVRERKIVMLKITDS